MTRCGGTVTGTRARYKCFLRQLQSNSLILHTTMCDIFPKVTTSSNQTHRTQIGNMIRKSSTFDLFKYMLHDKSPHLANIITWTLDPYLELIGLDEPSPSDSPNDHIKSLWHFMTRLIYERPSLLQEDNMNGDHVMYIRSMWKSFISEQVRGI
jgi:hypothetical protein